MQRDLFLRRVASRLAQSPATGDAAEPAAPVPATAVPGGPAELLRLFVERFREAGGSADVVPTRSDVHAAVARLLQDRQATSAPGEPALIACPPSLVWDEIADARTGDARRAAFGLTEADWGIAATGTLVLLHAGQRGRACSLVPPAVGFLLPASRLVPHLGVVLRIVHESGVPPACVTFVSGPSHSADIAGQLVYGVHGPGEVHVWVIEDE